jgi:ribulose-bisphosphate carboxylase small chain
MPQARYLPPLANQKEIECLIESDLSRDWVVRVEYIRTIDSTTTASQWQQWGKAIYVPRQADAVLHDIHACRASYSHHVIRLRAEKYYPRSQLLYIVHQPEFSAHEIVRPQRYVDNYSELSKCLKMNETQT